VTTVQRNAILLLLIALVACEFSLTRAQAHPAEKIVEVTNTLDIARPENVIEIGLSDIKAQVGIEKPGDISVEDESTHQFLPVQPYSSTGGAPDHLLVLVSLNPRQKIHLEFHESQKNPSTKSLVFGRLVPERKDDFAWENDKVAYRVYGPALQAGGEISSGIDVWSKRVPALIINEWYKRDAEGARTKNPALTYHKDDGTGLDSYDVGKTRGCGGTAVWNNGKLYVSKNFTSAKTLAAGPIRFSFELEYAPWNAEDTTISEKKVITLDAGSHLNKIQSTFSFSGAQPVKIAVGLATHAGARTSNPIEGRILSVWEPLTDPGAGNDGTAIVLPLGSEAAIVKAEGNAFFVLNANSVKPLTYYAGAGWSKSDIPSQKVWNDYLRVFSLGEEHPLEIHWK
jgi:unsaturated rhamnogalacturonyl hydrolase